MATGYFSADQLTTALTEAVQTHGLFPSRDSGGTASDEYLGLVRTFAFPFAPDGAPSAQGQTQNITSNIPLFSVLGTAYGGNGSRTFGLPDLQGIVPIGADSGMTGVKTGSDTAQVAAEQFPASLGGVAEAVPIGQPDLAITYAICVSGEFPSPSSPASGAFLGEVIPFLGNFAPSGFAIADGSTLSISHNEALFAVLGTTYGGDGMTTFALPNLTGRAIVGATSPSALGQVVTQASVTLIDDDLPVANGGSAAMFNIQNPSVELNYIICVADGIYPSLDTGGGDMGDQPILGEVRAFAGSSDLIPQGWVLANGQALSVDDDAVMFSLIGTTYGGDGITTFDLPNLSGREVSGAGTRGGTPYDVGGDFGSDTSTLVVTDDTPCYLAGTLILTDHGEVPVEALAEGDTLITAAGERRPVRWIGRRSYAGRFLRGNPNLWPICFHAGSLCDGLPRRDLLVSPEHAMLLDGVLVAARLLVNGIGITQRRGLKQVEYYHVELDSHDVILAEGAPSESFVDDDSRGMFHNAAEWARRHPGRARVPTEFCTRRVESGPELDAIRRRLDGEAGRPARTGSC